MKRLVATWLQGFREVGTAQLRAEAQRVGKKIVALPSADAVVNELIRLAREDANRWGEEVWYVLDRGGRAIALKQLEKIPARERPWDQRRHERLLKDIKLRLGLVKHRAENGQGARPLPEDNAPAEVRLGELRKALSGKPDSKKFAEALAVLTRHEPAFVAKFLVRWTNRAQDLGDKELGYVLGSYFCWRCGKDRTRHFQTLLEAKDDFIRVAGAVYLCFEDQKLGTASLKKLAALDGDAGAWEVLSIVVDEDFIRRRPLA